MKIIRFTVEIEVPDDETNVHWQGILDQMEDVVAAKGYNIYDQEFCVEEV